MDLLESSSENFDVNFMMKEFPADLVNKLRTTGFLIDEKQRHKY
jgi:hypothetical protein